MIYLITGPAGVGKSTISKAIAKRLPKSAYLDLDSVYGMVEGGYVDPWNDEGWFYWNLVWDNAVSLIKNFNARGIDVTVDYVMSPETLEWLKDELSPENIDIKFVVLTIATLEDLVDREAQRSSFCELVYTERYSRFKEDNILEDIFYKYQKKEFDDKFYLDTTGKAVEKIVDEVLTNDRYFLEATVKAKKD